MRNPCPKSDNYAKRYAIGQKNSRRTILKITNFFQEKRFKQVFVLFHSSEVDMGKVEEEWDEHKDILLGQKEEGYRVLAFKRLAGLRWVDQNCDHVETVIKMDDDIFVDFARILPKGERSKYMKLLR